MYALSLQGRRPFAQAPRPAPPRGSTPPTATSDAVAPASTTTPTLPDGTVVLATVAAVAARTRQPGDDHTPAGELVAESPADGGRVTLAYVHSDVRDSKLRYALSPVLPLAAHEA